MSEGERGGVNVAERAVLVLPVPGDEGLLHGVGVVLIDSETGWVFVRLDGGQVVMVHSSRVLERDPLAGSGLGGVR
jgi:hypothetical protein